INLADVPLDGRHRPGAGGRDARHRAVQHWAAQVNQRGTVSGEFLQEPQRVVAGAAANVEDIAGVRRNAGRGQGDEIHRQPGIDRGRLTGFEVGEAIDIVVEPRANLVDGRFHPSRSRQCMLLRLPCVQTTRSPGWIEKLSYCFELSYTVSTCP